MDKITAIITRLRTLIANNKVMAGAIAAAIVASMVFTSVTAMNASDSKAVNDAAKPLATNAAKVSDARQPASKPDVSDKQAAKTSPASSTTSTSKPTASAGTAVAKTSTTAKAGSSTGTPSASNPAPTPAPAPTPNPPAPAKPAFTVRAIAGSQMNDMKVIDGVWHYESWLTFSITPEPGHTGTFLPATSRFVSGPQNNVTECSIAPVKGIVGVITIPVGAALGYYQCEVVISDGTITRTATYGFTVAEK